MENKFLQPLLQAGLLDIGDSPERLENIEKSITDLEFEGFGLSEFPVQRPFFFGKSINNCIKASYAFLLSCVNSSKNVMYDAQT
ncbi:hypothetical protein [Flagellimonas halotolerans]|uniref:Uncharacterized protein n=1 Tax=Flagellimonas halotolerans TaxID=3112164 RepID=A0ABU6IRI8_9FLAO|nr:MULTISPECIES: hypothetical protein [unclassified Allomuricauda]MEC3965807.1 hypothetical protein [Muricauda sp. SYSU M86414]MEC4265727.1 hypothetical protein [Muricauda sp. SYSU M84420]